MMMKKRCCRLLALLLAFALILPGGGFAAAAGDASDAENAWRTLCAAAGDASDAENAWRTLCAATGEEAAGEEAAADNMVRVVSEPAGADVYLDGELYAPATTPCEIPLSGGGHTLGVRMHGYEEAQLTVRPGENVTVQLKARIPEGPEVRRIVVNRDDHGSADGRLTTWAFYERFVLNGEPEPEWNEDWDEADELAASAYYALTDGISLREAIGIALNDNGWYDEARQIRYHYLIEFAEQKLNPYEDSDFENDTYYQSGDITCYGRGAGAYMNGEPLFHHYTAEGLTEDTEAKAQWSSDGLFTINGDRDRDGVPDVTLAGWPDYNWDGRRQLKLACSEVHVVGLRLEQTMEVAFSIPFWQPRNYFNVKEIYLTGCEFITEDRGVERFFGGYSNMYGYGAEGKGQPGTYDLDGYYITGCTFRKSQLGIIVGCGDMDYASMKHLVIQGNHFINGQIFVRNVDAHTWYMWGQYSEMGSSGGDGASIGTCDYNTLEDVMISGNLIEYTAEAIPTLAYDAGYGSVLHLGNANLGGSHNVTRNVTVRCNRSTMEQANIDAFQNWGNVDVSISNAVVGEGEGFDGYDLDLVAALCETSDNRFEGLTVEYNDFMLNRFELTGVGLAGNGQIGTGNLFRDIRIADNRIRTVTGLHLYGASGTSDFKTTASGTLQDLTVCDNEISVLRKTGWGPDSNINSSGEQDDFGLLLCGARAASYETNWDSSGYEQVWDKLAVSVSGVRFERNRVTGFAGGVLIAGAACDRTHYVTGIRVEDVTIADNEIETDGVNKNCRCHGILLVGAIDGGTDCCIRRVNILRNRVTAANGLMAAAFYFMGMRCRFGIRDNQILLAAARDNVFRCADPSGNGGFPIVTADAVSGWDEIPYSLGRSRVVLTESGNSASGFAWGSLKLAELSRQEAPPAADFLAAVQKSCDALFGGRYLDWSADGAGQTPQYMGVCDTANYRPGGCHRYYLSPCGFSDVPDDAYYAAPVAWAVEQQITDGTTPASFSPDASCTRAQFVTFLWRAVGRPEPAKTANPFADVHEGDYFYSPVLWALEKGITDGTSETSFSPHASCTRAQVVTFLWRWSGNPRPAAAGAPFTDVPADAYYFRPVLWAVEKGITDGTSDTTFSPDDSCTRAQCVTFLYRGFAG